MNEKVMVNDILAQINASLGTYAKVISESENPQFRQTIQQIRDNSEQFQYQLFKCAQNKQYYTPAEQAKQEEVQTVKNLFQNQ